MGDGGEEEGKRVPTWNSRARAQTSRHPSAACKGTQRRAAEQDIRYVRGRKLERTRSLTDVFRAHADENLEEEASER